MDITLDPLRTVLQFYGLKVTDEDVQFYHKNVHQFMLLPHFISTFGNGTQAPWIASDEAREFKKELCLKVREWILSRCSPPEVELHSQLQQLGFLARNLSSKK